MSKSSADENANTLENSITTLRNIMADLRTPVTGCSWDLQQNFKTIAPYTIEEAYEVADAIAREDMPELRQELGDLLLQVVYHARMAEEFGHFDLADVIHSICEKMVRRHPHVFGDAVIDTAEQQSRSWDAIKASERKALKGTTSALDGVAMALPALLRAQKIQARAARVGFDWPDLRGCVDKLNEEIAEVEEAVAGKAAEAVAEEVGDLLFAAVNVARKAGVDAETVLRNGTDKFERRFKAMELLAVEKHQVFPALGIDAQEALWQLVKQQEKR